MFWEQFYPTPPEIVSKMLDQIDWSNAKDILEPSAGKWDIIKAIEEKQKYNHRRKTISACEIDYNLRAILKEQHVNLIWFDFMELDSKYKRFDTIIMNPPFDNGADHLLKAWSMLDGWTLVSLLNKETISNPFSKNRKLLKKIIEDNQGQVEELWPCFDSAERKTNVEVVMITLKKESKETDNIFEWFQEDFLNEYNVFNEVEVSNELLAGDNDIEHLIVTSDVLKKQAIKTIVAWAKFKHYEQNLWKALGANYLYILKDMVVNKDDVQSEINKVIESINVTCWSHLFRKTKLASKITWKAYDDFIKEYSESKMDFNKWNISKVIDIIIHSQDKMFEQSINELFDEFTKHHEENRVYFEWWKTNSAWKLWKKVIIPWMVRDCFGWTYSLDTIYRSRIINDIDSVFRSISNQPWYRWLWHFTQRDLVPGQWYESDVLRIKIFKKGTMHMEITDKHLLDQFNLIVCKSRKWIPPVHSKEMKEEKQTSIL